MEENGNGNQSVKDALEDAGLSPDLLREFLQETIEQRANYSDLGLQFKTSEAMKEDMTTSHLKLLLHLLK